MSLTVSASGITFDDLTTLSTASISASNLARNSVGTLQLSAGAVTTDKIALGAVITEDIANGAVTAQKLGTTEQRQICKAWVNFNGSTNNNITGTYSQSGNIITVSTVSNHGLTQGQSVYITFQTGLAGAEGFIITSVTNLNVFTVTSVTSRTTSGNCTLNFVTIRSSYNVSTVTKNGVGDYTVNFTTPMTDINYCPVGNVSSGLTNGYRWLAFGSGNSNDTLQTTSAIRCQSVYDATSVKTEATGIFVQVFGN